MILMENHIATCFYIILSGQVEIFRVREEMKNRMGIVNAGFEFGERTMRTTMARRTACAATLMDSTMLHIDKGLLFISF